MDCVMIDRISFERLRDQSEELQNRNQELETENDKLKNCNQLMNKLVDSLENIKFNLEKTNELMRMKYSIDDSFQPFERDCLIWDEEYCNIKCLLTQLDDEELDESQDNYDNNEIIICDNDNQVLDDSQELTEAENQEFSEDINEKFTVKWTEDGVNDGLDESNVNNREDFDLITDNSIENSSNNTINAIVITEDVINRPKIRRNRKSLTPEGVSVSTIPGTKKFSCKWPSCEYATDSSGNFQKHYRIHTGEKPYKCDFQGCDYSCSDPGSIREHKRIHNTVKEFECDWPGCTWKFSTYKLLKNHTRACHTGEKPHKCDWPGCEKSFLAPYALRTHKLKHTGDRPFKCDITGCKGAFTRSTDLLRHKRETHCTERHYFCEYENCVSKFYRKDDLRHHIKRKHECPAFGRKKKSKKNESKVGRPLKKIKNEESFDEQKVIIDLNVAKVNQLKKSIQINFS